MNMVAPAEARPLVCPFCQRHLGVLAATYAELPACKTCGIQTTIRATSRLGRRTVESPAGMLEIKGRR